MTDLMGDLELYAQELDASGPTILVEELHFRHATDDVARRGVRPIPAWITAVAAAAVVLFIVGGLSLMFGGSEGSIEPVATTVGTNDELPDANATTATTVSAQSEPLGVFEWGDPLSRWVTEAEMTTLLEGLSERFYADTADGELGGHAVLSRPGGDLVWSVGHWSVGVHSGGGWHPTPTASDPRLPDGATYEEISQSYVFSGPNTTQSICITLTTPGTTASIDEEPNYEQIFFEVASAMLDEMGWAG